MPNLYFYIITASTFTSLYFYKKWYNTKNKYFVYFLIFTFLIDKACYLNRLYNFISMDNVNNNNPFFNLYSIVTFIFFFMFYKLQFRHHNYKNITNWFLGVFMITALIEIFCFKTNLITEYVMVTTIIGSVLFIITLLLFLYEIIKNKNIIFNVEKLLIFWISLGCLLFYVGVIPIIISYKELNFNGIFNIILNILNIVANLCFIIGFIYAEKKYDY